MVTEKEVVNSIMLTSEYAEGQHVFLIFCCMPSEIQSVHLVYQLDKYVCEYKLSSQRKSNWKCVVILSHFFALNTQRTQMARGQNNSDQMAQVLQPERFHRQREESADAERQGASFSASTCSSSSSPASPSSPSLSSPSATYLDHSPTTITSSAPSTHRATRPRDEPSPTQRDFVLGISTLDKMKKLSQSPSCLGELTANLTHTVLIDVRPQLYTCSKKKWVTGFHSL